MPEIPETMRAAVLQGPGRLVLEERPVPEPPPAIALAASGQVRLDPLVTHGFGLAEAEHALTVGAHDPTAVKTVVYPQR